MSYNLENVLPAELVQQIKSDSQVAEAVKKWVDALSYQRHRVNPLYAEAATAFRSTQLDQIDKGAEKYPEPLNADSWTIDQFVDHELMELVDGIHYIIGIRVKARKMRVDLTKALILIESDKREEKAYGVEMIRKVIKGL